MMSFRLFVLTPCTSYIRFLWSSRQINLLLQCQEYRNETKLVFHSLQFDLRFRQDEQKTLGLPKLCPPTDAAIALPITDVHDKKATSAKGLGDIIYLTRPQASNSHR